MSINSTQLHEEFNAFHKWHPENKMSMHDSKCQQNIKKNARHCLNDKRITSATSQKDLGNIVCENLKWKDCAIRTKSRAQNSLWFLKRYIHYKTTKYRN